MINFVEKNEKFNKRWDINSDLSYEQEFNRFRIRILNIFSDIDEKLSNDGVLQFCNVFGILLGQFGNDVINALSNEGDEKIFYKMLEFIFALEFEGEGSYERFNPTHRLHLLKPFINAVKISNIDLEITIEKGEIILFPRGEKLLDEALVNEVLGFLGNSSHEHFIDALKFYEKAQPRFDIKAAESLRRCVEEFLRYKLQNDVGLTGNKTALIKRLKEDKRDPQIRNIIGRTFDYFDQYFNENSKHNDGEINEAECEYLIYQTGTILRYIERSISSASK